MTSTSRQELLSLLDYVHARLNDRFDGMSEKEYLWEPVADCWSVRPDEKGEYYADRAYPDPEPAPFTTIAWRMWHIGDDCLLSYSDRFFEGLHERRTRAWPGTVAGAREQLNSEWARFRGHVAGLDDESLARALGPAAGPYAKDSYHALVLHALDEVIHHGAEIGVLRDLYRQRGSLDTHMD